MFTFIDKMECRHSPTAAVFFTIEIFCGVMRLSAFADGKVCCTVMRLSAFIDSNVYCGDQISEEQNILQSEKAENDGEDNSQGDLNKKTAAVQNASELGAKLWRRAK